MKLPKAEQRKIMEERDPSPIYEEEPKVKLFNVIIPIAPFGAAIRPCNRPSKASRGGVE